MSEHYVALNTRYDHATGGYTRLEWSCVSKWDIKDGGRLRREMHRCTYVHDLRSAQRWARRYKVECQTEPDARRSDYVTAQAARAASLRYERKGSVRRDA